MEKNKDSKSLINRKNELLASISACENKHSEQINTIFSLFNKNILSWISKELIKDVVKEFGESNTIDKGIPDITSKTIAFLKERRRCICGNCIEVGSKEYEELEKLLQYIPPKSLGTFIGQFVTEVKMRIENTRDYYEQNFIKEFGEIRGTESDIDKFSQEINTIDERLREMDSTSDIQKKYDDAEDKINSLNQEKENLLEKLGKIKGNKERTESQLNELVLKDKNNRAVATYKAYAEYIYQYLSKLYSEKEKEVRVKLQENINAIFKNIYDGKLSILIDEKYSIKVVADDFTGYKGFIETSTAQSMSIIFAFISGVIKMAKENSNEADTEMKLESEPYPLVMDAPLSSFDKKRVKNVCDSIPNIAEQVIMFSFDKDADIAKENMGRKIGKTYEFEKLNEFETICKMI